jgi:hypothetical protein
MSDWLHQYYEMQSLKMLWFRSAHPWCAPATKRNRRTEAPTGWYPTQRKWIVSATEPPYPTTDKYSKKGRHFMRGRFWSRRSDVHIDSKTTYTIKNRNIPNTTHRSRGRALHEPPTFSPKQEVKTLHKKKFQNGRSVKLLVHRFKSDLFKTYSSLI